MTQRTLQKSAPLIDRCLVEDSQNATRWAWLRDQCSTDQLQTLVAAIKAAPSDYARQRAAEEVADRCIAQLLLASESSAKPLASPRLSSRLR